MSQETEINKDEVIKRLRDMTKAYAATGNHSFATLFRDAADLIEERKTGQWIRAEDELGETWMCSQCCEEWTVEETVFDEFPQWAHYCPNCGARMVTDDV